MRAIQITQPGGPEVLQVAELPMPSLKEGEVLVRVHAAGVNRPDVLQRLGKYQPPQGASELPGLELAGEIIAGDVSGSAWQIGDMVCALVAGGAYAEYCAVALDLCMPIPKGWSAMQAASLPETFLTVWSNVFQRGTLASGESLLVHGGSSGIGVAAIQIAKALGHPVYVTAGTDEKCRMCEQLGATRAINYRTQNFSEEIRTLTGGAGVDLVLDMVGAAYLEQHMQCLADDGRLVVIALQGGARGTLDMSQVLRRRLTITGSTLRPRSLAMKAGLTAEVVGNVWPLIHSGAINPQIYRVFPLEQASAAHALMEEGSHIGKIMLQVLDVT